MTSTKPNLLWLTATPPGSGGGGPPSGGGATFVIIDDVIYITYGGAVWEAPVTFVGPTATPSGRITASDDTLYFAYEGGIWESPASETSGDTKEGEGVVINDTFYITIGGTCYAMPVTETMPPGVPLKGELSLVVIDGTEYIRIVFSDGEVRYGIPLVL